MNRHFCHVRTDSTEAGPAIDYCWEDKEGCLWAGNGEYESQVNFCPSCGAKAIEPCKVKSQEQRASESPWLKDHEDFGNVLRAAEERWDL